MGKFRAVLRITRKLTPYFYEFGVNQLQKWILSYTRRVYVSALDTLSQTRYIQCTKPLYNAFHTSYMFSMQTNTSFSTHYGHLDLDFTELYSAIYWTKLLHLRTECRLNSCWLRTGVVAQLQIKNVTFQMDIFGILGWAIDFKTYISKLRSELQIQNLYLNYVDRIVLQNFYSNFKRQFW